MAFTDVTQTRIEIHVADKMDDCGAGSATGLRHVDERGTEIYSDAVPQTVNRDVNSAINVGSPHQTGVGRLNKTA